MQLHISTGQLWFLIVSPLWFTVVQAQQFLKEPPAFLKPCPLNDTQSGVCLSGTIESIFQHWRDGVPGLQGVGALDPFRVGKIRIAQSVPPNLEVQVALRNMSTVGLSKAKILNSTTAFISGNYLLGFHVRISQLNITSRYKLKGHILLLNLNSSGLLSSEMDKLEFYVALKMHPQLVQGLTFMNVSDVKTEIVSIDGVRINLTNLFNGNKELESNANELFNENWRVLFDILRPVLTQTFDAVLLDRFSKIFQYVPATFLFEEFA